LRWDGTAWKRVPSPSPAAGGILFGVAATSARSAWAVGLTARHAGAASHPLILRWNGLKWTRVPGPSPAGSSGLEDVSVTSASNAWAVGASSGIFGNHPKTLILHWNGISWK
jgi:hypothetical protein